MVKTVPVASSLEELATAIEEELGIVVQSFEQSFPRKSFVRGTDFGQSISTAGWVPSAALNVKMIWGTSLTYGMMQREARERASLGTRACQQRIAFSESIALEQRCLLHS